MYNNMRAIGRQMKTTVKMKPKSQKQDFKQKAVEKRTAQVYESSTNIGDGAKIKPKVMQDACMHNRDSLDSCKSNKKIATAWLCEMTRLRTQQKYLECAQVKLNATAFKDPPEVNGLSNNKINPIGRTVEEIEHLKHTLTENLRTYRESNLQDVYHVGIFVEGIQDDIKSRQKLKDFSVQTLRDRLIGINAQLMQLAKKNATELADLKIISKQLEAEAKELLMSSKAVSV